MYEKDWKREYERLERQIEDDEYDRRLERDQEYEQREQERRRRRAEAEEMLHYADNWGEAFSKGLTLFRREASEEAHAAAQYPDEPNMQELWFGGQVEQIEFAQSAWSDEMRAIAEEVHRIRKEADAKIAALEAQARNKAADRVDGKFGETCLVSEFLRDDNPNGLTEW